MKLACHQPNFLPYLGYFEKINNADVFAFSDTVKYSRGAFFNYNFVVMDGHKHKLTVPINRHMDSMLKDVSLSDWKRYRKKLLKTLEQCYRKAPYFNTIMPEIARVIDQDYECMAELNIRLVKLVCQLLEIETSMIRESELGLDSVEKNEDIVSVCKVLGCSTYISGQGGKEYLDLNKFKENGIDVEFSSEDYDKLSVIDYLFHNGGGNPWKN